MPCEHLFSASKQVADDRHATLGSNTFEELQLMKFVWHNNIRDLATWNLRHAEEIDLGEYEGLLKADEFTDEIDVL